MFETLVLVCLATNPNLCQELKDLYGPYVEKKQCIQRAYEIAKELPEHMPGYVAMKYKCLDVADKRVDKENI
jgi:hypothetical protein|tara:strand:+ start:942 stop:1157 length:216 start_codon:yes stop_codon:yes gene_type:complete